MNPGEIITGLLLLVGGFFTLVAALGVIRFRDFFNRLHAATKASTLGVGSSLAAVSVFFWDGGILFKAVLSVFFLFLTIPVGAQLLARSQWRPEIDPPHRDPDLEETGNGD